MFFEHRKHYLAINLDLVKSQKITFEKLCQIVKLHKERFDLFYLLNKTKDRTFIKIIFNQLTEVEFELQMLWGFELNATMHRSWAWPQCVCPKEDNAHSFPHYQWVNKRCPLHGD